MIENLAARALEAKSRNKAIGKEGVELGREERGKFGRKEQHLLISSFLPSNLLSILLACILCKVMSHISELS